ncbi:MAG: peptidase MA family metallohydrolase [Candidatus Sericytochromatia bacterium]
MKRLFFILFFILTFTSKVLAEDILNQDNIFVSYKPEQKVLANTIKDLASTSYQEISKKIPLKEKLPLNIRLLDNTDFKKMYGEKESLIQGVAYSDNNLIVLKAENIFKTSKNDIKNLIDHEIIHIFLGNYISHQNNEKLPRWFNEGVAQWYSSGISELFSTDYQNSLQAAFLTNNLIHFSQITNTFSTDKNSFILAYAQSLSIIDFMVKKYGEEKLWLLIKKLPEYNDLNSAFKNIYGLEFYTLEDDWRNVNKKSTYTWDYYLSTHITNFIDFTVGLVALFVFIILYFRNKKKKKLLLLEEES